MRHAVIQYLFEEPTLFIIAFMCILGSYIEVKNMSQFFGFSTAVIVKFTWNMHAF